MGSNPIPRTFNIVLGDPTFLVECRVTCVSCRVLLFLRSARYAYEWLDSDSDNQRSEEVDEDPHDGDTPFISMSDVSLTAHNSRFTKAAIELPDEATIDSVEV